MFHVQTQEFHSSLGQRLKVFRENCGLSVENVSETLNIPESDISHFEQGTQPPTPEILLRMSRLFKISIADLLNVDGTDQYPALPVEDALHMATPMVLMQVETKMAA